MRQHHQSHGMGPATMGRKHRALHAEGLPKSASETTTHKVKQADGLPGARGPLCKAILRTDVCFGFLHKFKSLCRGGGHITSCARSSTSTAHSIGESLSVDFGPRDFDREAVKRAGSAQPRALARRMPTRCPCRPNHFTADARFLAHRRSRLPVRDLGDKAEASAVLQMLPPEARSRKRRKPR